MRWVAPFLTPPHPRPAPSRRRRRPPGCQLVREGLARPRPRSRPGQVTVTQWSRTAVCVPERDVPTRTPAYRTALMAMGHAQGRGIE